MVQSNRASTRCLPEVTVTSVLPRGCPGAGSWAGSGWPTPGIAGCHSSVTGGGKVLWAPPDGPSQRLRQEQGPVTTLGTEKLSPPPTRAPPSPGGHFKHRENQASLSGVSTVLHLLPGSVLTVTL